jgi:hypothetical protein
MAGSKSSEKLSARLVFRIYTAGMGGDHVRWVPCHHGTARPQDGEDGLQIWRVAVNVLNKQSRATDKV